MKRDAIGLPVQLDVEGRHAVVIGGGAEAEDKARRLLDGGAWVTVVAAEPDPPVFELFKQGRLMLIRHEFQVEDIASADLVFVCLRDSALAERARAAADGVGAAFWACDDPERSHLAMPALARLGRARIAISTGGASPALAGRLREALEREFGETFARFVERLGVERERAFEDEPDGEARRERLRALVDELELRVEVRYPAWFDRREG